MSDPTAYNIWRVRCRECGVTYSQSDAYTGYRPEQCGLCGAREERARSTMVTRPPRGPEIEHVKTVPR